MSAQCSGKNNSRLYVPFNWIRGRRASDETFERNRPVIDGGAEEDRTPDLRIANATLSQLSYGPTRSQ